MDPDVVEFQLFLLKLRDGKNTEEDWNTFRKKYSYYVIGTNS